MDRQLINYLPDFLKEIREIKVIMETEQHEVEKIWSATRQALDDQFIETAGVECIERWEKILEINSKGSDDLEVRKFRVLSRLNEHLPYTFRTLEKQLASLCGRDNYSVDLNQGVYTITVKIALLVKKSYTDVEEFLNRVTPANMIIELIQLYNSQLDLSKYTHGQLALITHHNLRNEVIPYGE